MPKSYNQKLKILYLMRILLSETDEAHMLTVKELISKLAALGIAAERKTVYDDIDVPREFGLDIVMEKRDAYGYYVASREFELPELKLLADAVQSSRFITERKTMSLIKKLGNLASKYDAGKLHRQVYIQERVKSMNESIYYSIDTLHRAISENKKISFRYSDYNVRKEQIFRKSGVAYIVSPAALAWTDENYYLLAYNDEREGINHYRVDRMSNVKILGEPRHKAAVDFRLVDYSKKVFGMFGGEETTVLLRMDNKIIRTAIDRFGRDIIVVPDGEDHYTIRVQVAVSPVFYGWLFQFGGLCQVVEPQSIKDKLRNYTVEFLSKL